MKNSQLAVVVFSCDKYADLWPIFFRCFFDFWQDCPYNIYLIANEKKYQDSRVTTVLSGNDTDWSSSVRRSLEQVPERNYLFFFEDILLASKVDSAKFKAIFDFYLTENVNYLRLRPNPKPTIKYNDQYGVISAGDMYRTSLVLTVWKKEVFFDLLKDGESAWQFEICGSIRSDKFDQFYSTWKSFFNYIHVVERGKWINAEYKKLTRLGYEVQLQRPFLYQSWAQEKVLSTLLRLKHWFINLFPASRQRRVIKLFGGVKRIILFKK
ncbi:hypothetical protein L3V82_00745 [Thiotrichales bacterium 19S3-7]|nr:hypothetical protein [Thiotrichales bacterium 19S3-7]MCF6800690.1 hypothetical protein [Thiotrichales bacterium 19S3-11]